jgi:transposase InsO family protein
MAYTKNPHLPRVRIQAVLLVRSGWSIRKVARRFGYHHTAVMRWVKKAHPGEQQIIPTRSSRPYAHPKQLKQETVEAVISQRKKNNRCAEVVHKELQLKGIKVSLSSVKRTLKRNGLIKERSPWKRWHFSVERPIALNAGDLAQIDTIHIMLNKEKFYVYTLIDLHSRWAYAKVSMRINTHNSLRFLKEAQRKSSFKFKMIQTDHGSEFSSWFTERAGKFGIAHRHSRVRKANDNGHIERFNRTLKEECLKKVIKSPIIYQEAINCYLPYYNGERLHLGINFKTPLEMMPSY